MSEVLLSVSNSPRSRMGKRFFRMMARQCRDHTWKTLPTRIASLSQWHVHLLTQSIRQRYRKLLLERQSLNVSDGRMSLKRCPRGICGPRLLTPLPYSSYFPHRILAAICFARLIAISEPLSGVNAFQLQYNRYSHSSRPITLAESWHCKAWS